MSAIRVNYTISEEAKKNTDYFKKQFKTNISELVDSLLKFDNNSIEKMFELYSKINPEVIEKYSRLNTKEGTFVWNKNHLEAINKFPLSKIKGDDMINNAALMLESLSLQSTGDQYVNAIKNQKDMTNVVLHSSRKLDSLEKQIKDLQDSNKKFLEIINLMQKKENLESETNKDHPNN